MFARSDFADLLNSRGLVQNDDNVYSDVDVVGSGNRKVKNRKI